MGAFVPHGAVRAAWIARTRTARIRHHRDGRARTALAWRRQAVDGETPFEPADAFHHEAGLALSGLLGMSRIDVTARLDAPAVSLGASAARIF